MSSASLKKLLKNFKLSESSISMVLGTLVVIVVGGLVINYFRSGNRVTQSTPAAVQPEGTTIADLPAIHKVEAGESLWKISEKYYGSGYNWVDIAKENNLTSPNSISTGQELTIPKVEAKNPVITEKPVSEPATQGESITDESYIVVKGDCLWNIAVRAYGDGYQWVKIARENGLVHPNLIHPGNVLKLTR
jgi:nucleoid-associated protein YgaU